MLGDGKAILPLLILAFALCVVGSCECDKRIDQQENGSMEAREQLERDLEAVAEITGSDSETRNLVQEELSAARIECWIEGSVIYVVSVRRKDAQAARQVLCDSDLLRGKQMKVIDAGGKVAP